MTSFNPPSEPAGILALARRHDLELDPDSLEIEELGLDFRVAIGTTAATASSPEPTRWVLRIPRRDDVLSRAEVEARALAWIGPQLGIAVPDWRIHSPELIAYPLLPGRPALTLDDSGTPHWHVDMSSRVYAASLGDFLAQLHGLDAEHARSLGLEHRDPAQVRERWREDIDRVAAEFTVAPRLLERWSAWLEEDSFWPGHSVLVHGEVYPGHTLVDGERLSAVLDWTTAAVGDPARDLMFHQSVAPAEIFEVLLEHYERGGGRTWPRLAEHCTEMLAASAVAYGLYALQTRESAHLEAAAMELNPPQ